MAVAFELIPLPSWEEKGVFRRQFELKLSAYTQESPPLFLREGAGG
jgi:hypothetical protein